RRDLPPEAGLPHRNSLGHFGLICGLSFDKHASAPIQFTLGLGSGVISKSSGRNRNFSVSPSIKYLSCMLPFLPSGNRRVSSRRIGSSRIQESNWPSPI